MDNEKKKNIKSAEILWHEYERYIRKLCEYKLQAYPDKIDDCVSDTFLAMLEELNRGGEIRYPKAWLFSVANNKIMDVFRNIRKQNDLTVSLSEEYSENEISYELLDNVGHEKLIEIKEEVLSHLSSEEMRLLNDRYTEKKSIKEISQIYKTTENNVYQKLFRLRKKTQGIIKKILNDQN